MILIPPQALEIEKHVIGSMLLGNENISQALQILKSEDFYCDAYSILFSAIEFLFRENRAADALTVSEYLKGKNKDESATLLEINAEVVSGANILEYCKIVKEKSFKRRQIKFAKELLQRGYSEDSAQANQEFMEKMVFGFHEAENKKKLRHIREVLADSFTGIERRQKGELTGIATGLRAIDRYTAGLQRTDLIVIGGRPGQGKTAICGQIGIHAAKAGKVVAMFEGEMVDRAVVDRALFAEAELNQQILKHGELKDSDYPKLSIALGKITDIPFFIDDTAGITPLDIRSKCRRLKIKVGLDLIIIDNIQRMKSDSGAKDLRVRAAEVSEQLKEIAKEFDVPVLAISHIRRLEGGEKSEPTMADLQESGNIEQNADIILLLHRKDLYGDPIPGEEGKTRLIYGKFREGALGYQDLFFEKTLVTFCDWDKKPIPKFNHKEWEIK